MSAYSLKKRSKPLVTARRWGVGIIAGAALVALFASEIHRIRELPADVSNWMYIALLFVCIALVGLWIWCTEKELELLFDWMQPVRYEPPSDLKETATIVGLGVLLVALALTARDPTAFGAVFTLYSAVVMFAVIHLNQEIRQVVDESRRRLANNKDGASDAMGRLTEIYLNAILILEEYFLVRPHTRRHIAILAISAVGLLTAIAGRYFELPVLRQTAYVIFIVLIVISEALIAHWRNVRDHKLRPVTAERNEIEGSDNGLQAQDVLRKSE